MTIFNTKMTENMGNGILILALLKVQKMVSPMPLGQHYPKHGKYVYGIKPCGHDIGLVGCYEC